MTPRWQHQTIALTCARHGAEAPITTEASVFGALAVHRTTHMPWTRARWSITHVPTGFHVSTANTERLARRFVREVTPLIDWSRVMGLAGMSAEFWKTMHAAMQRAHDGQYVSEVRL